MTKLEGPLRRELSIKGLPHVITLTPDGFKLTQKGRRLGLEIAWTDLVSGDAAMAAALNASLAKAPEPASPPKKSQPRRRPAPRRSRAVRSVME